MASRGLSRLAATNFTSAFPKAGYLGIKTIFDENEINYSSRTIIQASDLKETLEKLGIKNKETTLVSIDAKDYYPSVRFKLVKKAVTYFSKGLTRAERTTIDQCLEMIKFGMANTLLSFEGQYYEYDGGLDANEKGLTIGGYESAWLADLVGAYILDNTQQHFDSTSYHGLYRDDGFAVFKGTWTYEMIIKWRENFQKSVNKLAEGDYLVFTCDIWLAQGKRDSPPPEVTKDNKLVTVCRKQYFPYLDMKLVWSKKDEELQFQVYRKPNQQLKYLNTDSTHTRSCFKAIPKGVYKRLAKLTTMTESNANKTLKEIYPIHFQKLELAKLVTDDIPTLKEEIQKREAELADPKRDQTAKHKKRDRKRKTYFCVGFSNIWKIPIHKTIKSIRDKYNLKWLKVSMSYHRFTNLRETFQGDLTGKINHGIESKDFMTEKCSCHGNKRGICDYNNICETKL